MKTVEQKLENFTLSYPLERIAPLEKCLFLDIETTGFTAKSSSLYLIGCAYFKEGCWYIRQWFAENPSEEAELLISFLNLPSLIPTCSILTETISTFRFLRKSANIISFPIVLNVLKELISISAPRRISTF